MVPFENSDIKPPKIKPPIEKRSQKPETNSVPFSKNGTIWEILELNPLKLNPLLKKSVKTWNKFGTILEVG